MLIDKGYYDYDYQDFYNLKLERLKTLKPKSNSELQAKLSRMGFGNIMARDEDAEQHPLTPSQLQAEVMKEENSRI